MKSLIIRLVMVTAASAFLTTAAIGVEFCVSDPVELQDALTAAEANGEDDIIRVEQGTYNGTFIYESREGHAITLLGGYTANCADRVLDPSNTILNGNDRFYTIGLFNRDGGNLEIEGFTITNSAGPHGKGLSVMSQSETGMSGHITINRNIITGINSLSPAGGAYVITETNEGIAGDITITDNIISENTGHRTGGVFVWSVSYTGASGTISLINNQIKDNTGGSGFGGGANLRSLSEYGSAANVLVTGNIVTGNKSSRPGGGIYAQSIGYSGPTGTVTITGNTITDNVADGDEAMGGGISANVYTGGPHRVNEIIIRDNIISRNTSSSHGGGVYANSSTNRDVERGEIILDNNTLEDNHSGFWGGGIMAQSSGRMVTGNIFITNSSLSGNTPSQIHATTSVSQHGLTEGDITLENITMNGNLSPTEGDGIYLKSGREKTSNVSITGVTITGLDGYGLKALGENITMTGCRFSDNTGYGASLSGRNVSVSDSEFNGNQYTGLFVGGDDIMIHRNIVKGNTCTPDALTYGGMHGGGIEIHASRQNWPPNRVEVINNIIAGNTIINGSGGGIGYLGRAYNTFTLSHNTIVQNTSIAGPSSVSGLGGGVYLRFPDNQWGNTAFLRNNIIWGNTATGTVWGVANDINLTGCLYRTGHKNIYSDVHPPDWTHSSGNMDVDPRFLYTSDPDPARWDYHLAPDSPAIDVGIYSPPAAEFDFEGEARPYGYHLDIGADEYTDTDDDGVADHEENGPDGENPDYNGDGTPDYQQSNVASLHTFDRQYYITLASPDGTELTGVRAVEPPDNLPPGVDLPYGLFEFTINKVINAVTVTIRLPDGETPNTYVKCDPDNGCDTFLYDGQTGATFSENVIALHFVDGGRGDQDGVINGVIVDPGGPGIAPNQPPVAICRDITVSTDPGTCSAFASVDAGSYDPDSDPVHLTFNPSGPYPLGVTRVTLTVTDDKGMSDSCTAQVTVIDQEPPKPEPLPMITGECSAEITSIPIAMDNCGGTITGATSDPLQYTEQGTYEVHWTFDDGNGNNAAGTQTVIVRDTSPPVIIAPPDMTVEAVGPSGQAVDIGIPVVTDNCDASPMVSSNAPALFPLGTTTVTWTAADSRGNTAEATQLVTVQDTTAPVISLTSPKDGETYPNTLGSLLIEFNAEDAVDTEPDITATLDGETITGQEIDFCKLGNGTQFLVITATDDAGNQGMDSATFVIEPLEFKGFEVKYMTIRWARDQRPFPWKKRSRHKKDDTFNILGKIELPEGYKLTDLSKTATVKVSIAGHSGSDTVKFRERPLKTWGTVWKYRGYRENPPQGINIQKMSIWWTPQGGRGSGRGRFHIRGALHFPPDIGKETIPSEAVVTMEIPVSPQSGCGSLLGDEKVVFRVHKRINLWHYHKRHGQRH